MQQFKNGEEVEVYKSGHYLKAKYIGICKNMHVVKANNGLITERNDSSIRPIQLICDEARELIELTSNMPSDYKYIAKIESEAMLNEFASLPSTCVFGYGACDSFELENYAKSLNLPELNLKTGEVTPVEVDENFNMEVARSIVKDLRNALKEKDKEIQLRDTFLANYKSQLDKSEAKLKDKDAENEQLKKDVLIKENDVLYLLGQCGESITKAKVAISEVKRIRQL